MDHREQVLDLGEGTIPEGPAVGLQGPITAGHLLERR